jgi:hypothetical protein
MADNSKTSKNIQIKSHGWHNVILTGDLLTGDTYKMSQDIKAVLGGKWDADRKGWIVDLDKINAKLAGGNSFIMHN